jgi:hypothetical protein
MEQRQRVKELFGPKEASGNAEKECAS